ncbi:MAG: hypothetical protein K2M11_08225 [Paramuribaculum sp.]|nr:hypothetical protein [Paramuribaculum sp.]
MKNIIKIAIVAIIVVTGFLIYTFAFSSKGSISVSKGNINKIETMVELCAIDFYNEVAVVDTVDNWVCFGKQKQRGSISFDIENIETDITGDTVKIILPTEIIEVMESTDKESWVSVDSKDLDCIAERLSPSRAPKEVWSKVKQNAFKNSKKKLYQNGVVERARIEASQSLQDLMEKVYRKPVKVIDPTPKGAHYNDFQ